MECRSSAKSSRVTLASNCATNMQEGASRRKPDPMHPNGLYRESLGLVCDGFPPLHAVVGARALRPKAKLMSARAVDCVHATLYPRFQRSLGFTSG